MQPGFSVSLNSKVPQKHPCPPRTPNLGVQRKAARKNIHFGPRIQDTQSPKIIPGVTKPYEGNLHPASASGFGLAFSTSSGLVFEVAERWPVIGKNLAPGSVPGKHGASSTPTGEGCSKWRDRLSVLGRYQTTKAKDPILCQSKKFRSSTRIVSEHYPTSFFSFVFSPDLLPFKVQGPDGTSSLALSGFSSRLRAKPGNKRWSRQNCRCPGAT